jgi:hypothetical protein
VPAKEYVKRRYVFGIKGIPRKETNWLEVSADFPSTLFSVSLLSDHNVAVTDAIGVPLASYERREVCKV